MQTNDLTDLARQYLVEQGFADISAQLAELFYQYILTWQVPEIKPHHINAIIAFAFGHRILKNGNKVPGPVNEQLSRRVLEYYQEFQCPVWAQWEVAEGLTGKIPSNQLSIVYPVYDRTRDSLTYLSTKGMLSQVKEVMPPSKKLLVVAHYDHLWRCVHLAQKWGYEPYARQRQMPREYDPESAQAWTTSRRVFVISELMSRLGILRAESLKNF